MMTPACAAPSIHIRMAAFSSLSEAVLCSVINKLGPLMPLDTLALPPLPLIDFVKQAIERGDAEGHHEKSADRTPSNLKRSRNYQRITKIIVAADQRPDEFVKRLQVKSG